jgi:hypothetical protein
MQGALPEDNIFYYIAYAIILVVFYSVLKSPKKSDDSDEKSDNSDNKNR